MTIVDKYLDWVEKHVEKTQRYTYTVPSYIVDKDEE